MPARPSAAALPTPTAPVPPGPGRPVATRLLITAGPTHEPIDRVRYIGNRSSGRLGVALADAAAARTLPAAESTASNAAIGPARRYEVTLLLGPTPLTPADSQVRVRRFLTTSDLQTALEEEAPRCDVLVMAAAVADYRPRPAGDEHQGKMRRAEAALTIDLEPTPDLLAAVSAGRRPGQLLVGFALEPRARLMESARSKLVRKGLDLIVANPLETMDAPTIEATVLDARGLVHQADRAVGKSEFAHTLLDLIEARLSAGSHIR